MTLSGEDLLIRLRFAMIKDIDKSDVVGAHLAESLWGNCVRWIAELGRQKDLTINLHHVMDFSSVPTFEAIMLNTGTVVHSYGE